MTYYEFMRQHVCDDVCGEWTQEQHKLMFNFLSMLTGNRVGYP